MKRFLLISLNSKFDVVAPNKVWTTDITYVWTLEGWLYVAIVLDLFSRQIVGWSIADHMRTSLCIRAYKWHFGVENLNQALYIIQIEEANMPAKNTEINWVS